MNSLSFKPGDIVVATLLFSELVGAKKRPALVISNSSYNDHSEDVVVLKITSKGNSTSFDVSLTPKDLVQGILQVESQIMADNPVTVYRPIIEQKIGRITEQKLKEVKRKMKELYEL